MYVIQMQIICTCCEQTMMHRLFIISGLIDKDIIFHNCIEKINACLCIEKCWKPQMKKFRQKAFVIFEADQFFVLLAVSASNII